MKKALLLFTILFSVNTFFGQERFENKQYGFSIEKPKNWNVASNEEIIKNLDKLDLNEEKLAELLKNNNGSVLLTSFFKYKTNEHAGLIPTIKINVRLNPAKAFTDFKTMISQSSKGFEKVFPDFKYIEEPKEIEISGIKSIFFIGKYSMKLQNGKTMLIKSRTYAIPYKNYFFQLNFIDGQVEDDCTEEYNQLIKTVIIGNKK